MLKRLDTAPRRAPRPAPADPLPWVLLFLVALGLRVAHAWMTIGPDGTPTSDSATYHAVAVNLARGAGFAMGSGTATWPTAFVPPVLPWLVSLLYRVIGPNYFAATLLQCVIGALVPLLLAALAGALFGSPVARTAGWMAALHPLLVYFSSYLLTEAAFTVALLLALLASVSWIKDPRAGRALGTGLLWGLAALTRPTALPLPLLVLAWAWAPLGLLLEPRARVRQALLLLLGVALAVGPWTLRNAIALHAFVPVTTGAGRALLDSNNALNWADPAQRGGARSVYEIEPYATVLRGHDEPTTDRLARAEALRFLRAHAAEWPAMAAAKLARFWRLNAETGTTRVWQRPGAHLRDLLRIVDPLLVWSLVMLPLALWGLGLVLRSPRRWFLALAPLTVLYFTLLAVVFWGALRVRAPVEPLVVLFSAAGFEDLRRRLRPRARGLRVIEGTRPAA